MTRKFYLDREYDLRGPAGNSLAIVGTVSSCLKQLGATKEELGLFREDACSSDYNYLLKTCESWLVGLKFIGRPEEDEE